MNRWRNKVAVVTGASSGIGAATVTELVKHGMQVVGLARRITKMNELKSTLEKEQGKFYPIECDLTNESQLLKAVEWIKTNLGGIDVLVNNAGILKRTNLTDGSTNDWEMVFKTNVISLCVLTREAVKSMKERNTYGYIIHICSILGHKILPNVSHYFNVYPASKFAVRALAETLRVELTQQQERKIKVTNLSPGLVLTEIFDVSEVRKDLDEVLSNIPGLSSENIADNIVYLLSTPPNVQITELTVEPI